MQTHTHTLTHACTHTYTHGGYAHISGRGRTVVYGNNLVLNIAKTKELIRDYREEKT